MTNILKNKQMITIGSLVLLLVGIPALLYLNQQQQETRSRAGASTTLYYTPSSSSGAPLQTKVGDKISVDVMINPGNNLPSLVKLHLTYDATKFQVADSTSFVSNATAFPTTLEGPIIANGNVYVSLSIGSDGTKSIQQVTKVGTLTLTAIAPTTASPSVVSFGDKSEILSLATTDQANENVLSTTTPAYISILAVPTPTTQPTTAPTVTTMPTATVMPTATTAPTITTIPTSLPTIAATATVVPSVTTALTATAVPPVATATLSPLATTLSFKILMHGIGNSGDNANPTNSALSNKSPLHQQRQLDVEIYDVNNKLAASASGLIAYNSADGNFIGSIPIADIPQGQYVVKVKSPSHLRRIAPGIQTIAPLQNNSMPEATLIAGDVNGDNLINILDYNLVIGCYSDLLPAISCNETNKILTDLNDDGAVNQVDYNFFLREITVQAGS